MYVNPAFKTADELAWDYVRSRGFGAVIAVGDDGFPVASQVPLLVIERAGKMCVEFHLARPNPQHKVFQRNPKVLIVVSGPDAYISPDWYASADQVPTWNYLAAHIRGEARAMPHEKALDHVEAMSLAFEERLKPKKPWSTSKMTEAKRQMMLRGIVPIAVEVESIEASRKLGQNKELPDRAAAAHMLAWRAGWNEAPVAELMQAAIKADKPTG